MARDSSGFKIGSQVPMSCCTGVRQRRATGVDRLSDCPIVFAALARKGGHQMLKQRPSRYDCDDIAVSIRKLRRAQSSLQAYTIAAWAQCPYDMLIRRTAKGTFGMAELVFGRRSGTADVRG
jgi:hypothetical protein